MSQSKVIKRIDVVEKTASGLERYLEAAIIYKKGIGFILSVRGKERLMPHSDLVSYSVDSPAEVIAFGTKRFSDKKLEELVDLYSLDNGLSGLVRQYCEANKVTLT
jgi:hypothetical protein